MNGRSFCTICLGGLFIATAHGDGPVYDEDTGILVIPEVAVDGRPGHFQNVVLEPDGSGGWVVGSMHEGVLVDSDYISSFGWTAGGWSSVHHFAHISGTFPNDCPELGRVTQRLEGDTVRIYLYYAANDWLRNPDGVVCNETRVEFSLNVPLDTYGLDAGEYTIRINDHHTSQLTLEEDNLLNRMPWQWRDCEITWAGEKGWSGYQCPVPDDE